MTNPPPESPSTDHSTDGVEAALAAHDIRNLLGTVIGHADLQLNAFSRAGTALPPDDLHTSLEAIRLSAAHAVTLCEEMLAMAEGRPAVLLPLELPALVEEAVEIFHARSGRVVPVELEGEDSLEVRGHRLDLQRAILNLMWNAFEAMNGVSAPILRLRWGRHEHGPWLEVVDCGPGLPDGHLADLTRPFRSANAGRGKVRGLGLHAVARVMRRHGGRLLGRNCEQGGGAVLRLEFGLEQELDFGPIETAKESAQRL